MQKTAINAGRNFLGKLQTGYHVGRHIAANIDRAYGLAKRLHDNHGKALANISPDISRVATKAMEGYEATRSAVLSANEAGERIAGILAK